MISDKIQVIAFDADDTLWRNEDIFVDTQDAFVELLAAYHDESYIREHLAQVQIKNLQHFGYGIKGFTLSMIETSIELTEGRITGHEIHRIIELAKQMLAYPIHLLPGIESTLRTLSAHYKLMVITKGDLLDQESKLARSGIADWFELVEIVSEKSPVSYQQILDKHGIATEQFLMIGNSLKSDILPVLNLGAQAIHIPYHTTWEHECVDSKTLEQYPQLITLDNAKQVLSRLTLGKKEADTYEMA